jgi:hypothetical protein
MKQQASKRAEGGMEGGRRAEEVEEERESGARRIEEGER